MILHSVESFLLQDYPQDHYHVVVISDNMSKETNEQLATLPITLLQPTMEKSSKAKALQFATSAISHQPSAIYDYVVILDADNSFLEICVTYFTYRDINSVYVLASRKSRDNVAFTVVNE